MYFPYLHKNATVVIDDQMTHLNENNEFVKIVGAAWTIACRILFDTVVAEKLVPALSIATPIQENYLMFHLSS